MKYSYGDRSSAYSVGRGSYSLLSGSSSLKGLSFGLSRPAPRTLRGGEFDWGGTSVK